jgi:hypothetical protein
MILARIEPIRSAANIKTRAAPPSRGATLANFAFTIAITMDSMDRLHVDAASLVPPAH